MTWFGELFGFEECGYEQTRAGFEVAGARLRSRANGRSWSCGEFTTPSLAELRQEGRRVALPGRPRVTHEAVADVLELHALPENEGALFQVASQLNCLEFPSPSSCPEDGVTGYAHDPTQGPACSLAAAAATVHRNYFIPVGDGFGQTRDRQVDTLDGLARALGEPGTWWTVRNGYTFSSNDRLQGLAGTLADHDRETLLSCVRIGLQRDVGVTFARRFEAPEGEERLVSQAFCSAVSCAYSGLDTQPWAPLARLVLEAAYEASFWAAALQAARGGSDRIWITLLGGGAFGNEPSWILDAIRRALRVLRDVQLDVRVAHYRRIHAGVVEALPEG